MDTATKVKKKPRGRPAKNKIKPIDAPPKEIAQALVRAAERKGQERRKEAA
ncbi:MAG: hypothetical protein OXF55_16545 [Caldilineaceae bacterium]|nr:hypothetical protein [Caldilineaceae bacterium]